MIRRFPGCHMILFYTAHGCVGGFSACHTYAVTFTKNGTGYTNTTPASSVTHGGSVSFTVTLSTGYTNSANPSVTATNGTVSASKSGNTITYTVSNITAATTISDGAATLNSYLVTFKDGYTNETLKTETVNHGSAAPAPTPASYHVITGDNVNHTKFTGWDTAFDNVIGALTVTARYAEEAHDAWSGYTNDGSTHSRTCENCGDTVSSQHSWGEWINDEGSEATCTTGGTQNRKCANCGETETRDLPGGFGHRIAHSNLRGEGYCEYCGEFICNRCEDMEKFEELEIVGIFYRIVHFFIHLAHMISYHG